MKRCHDRLHYDRKFQIFIFLIGYINVNKGVFCSLISYLRIKSYNVLNCNNCSTDWSFPLNYLTVTDFCNLFSDVHSPITISIYGQSTINLESEHGCDLNVNLDTEEFEGLKVGR